MKRLIFTIVTVMLLCFTGCTPKEKPISYDVTICDSNFPQIFSALKPTRTPENKIEFQDFTKYNILEYINAICDENVLSITIYSEFLTSEDIASIVSFVKARNIPIIFALQNILPETLETYDKAFCVTTDYIYAAEIFAGKILSSWKDGLIHDRDENKIFAFSVLKDETSPDYLSTFYTNLVHNIEIYGIPLQQNEEVYPTLEETGGVLEASKGGNEGFIILSPEMLAIASAEYAPVGDGIELLSIYRGTENIYASYTSGQVCFVDYLQYFDAVKEIINNYAKHEYPLAELSFPVKNKTVYISPTI